MRYYLGIDGGGTKTVCLLSDENGRVIGRGMAGPSNYHTVGVAQTTTSIQEGISAALAQSGQEIREITGTVLGMSGVDRPDDHGVIEHILDGMNLTFHSRRVENDAVIALAGATVARPGVVIICGTGSIAFGINQQGERRRAGGWGPILGDEGSGYEIGRQSLVSAMRAADGRGPETILQSMVIRHLQLSAVEQLITRVHEQKMPRHEIADLTRLVMTAAGQGDQVAQDILATAGSELALAANAVIRGLRMQDQEFDIALAGGVVRSPSLVTETIKAITREAAPLSRVIQPRFEPVAGALLLALQSANDGLTDAIIGNVSDTIQKG